MSYDLCIKSEELIIYCSRGLKDLSYGFIDYYSNHIEFIKNVFGLCESIKVEIYLTDDEKNVNFVYGKSSFSGFFTEFGVFAYVDINGDKPNIYIIKGLMHELIHHLYKYYVYGPDNERITWVDEGIAQLFSGQKDEFKDNIKYSSFVKDNIKSISDFNLNLLNHNDRSFGNCNGYNLSYIAIRYLYENNSYEEFMRIIKNKELLLNYGAKILDSINEEFGINMSF